MSEARKLPTPPVRLFRGLAPEIAIPDVELGRPLRAPPVVPVPAKPLVDLSGKPKIILVQGAGNSGKSTWLRYEAEQSLARNPDCPAIFAAVGDRRDLAHYFPVAQPESFDPVQETKWLEALIAHCMEHQVSAAVDLDGGDGSVASIVTQQSDLAGTIAAAGVEVVAIYMLTPRITDLTTLATLERAAFQPRATALILNEGVANGVSFDAIQRHGAFRAAVERGAVVLRMPRLSVASAVEQRRILFAQARDAKSPEGREVSQLSAMERGRVAQWMTEMAESFAPIASWML